VSGQQGITIEGHDLPEAIVTALRRGEWKLPADSSATAELFTEQPTSAARLYEPGLMTTETAAWHRASAEEQKLYGGPGAQAEGYLTVDPESTVLIGDLGYDMPIALDYSASASQPRVVYLPSRAPGWIEVASDAAEFIRRLGASQPPHDQQPVSPRISHLSWGSMTVDTVGTGKDFKLYPGGGREWDWSETGTRHDPGIQPADSQELLDHGSRVVVLSRGMELRLQTMPETVSLLESSGVEVHVLETTAAVELYNRLAEGTPVGGLFHSTC
jgi:hypothetical protein